jgi:hypothetical protein
MPQQSENDATNPTFGSLADLGTELPISQKRVDLLACRSLGEVHRLRPRLVPTGQGGPPTPRQAQYGIGEKHSMTGWLGGAVCRSWSWANIGL